nr:MAG: aldo/keto reductase [Chloroflexota bacterium]
MRRTLGRSGIEVSALGIGGWAIGGPFLLDGKPDGWGQVDDAESIRAIQRAIELGVNFIDTADVYGTGHSERVIGEAIKGRRHEVVIATKFGFTYDEERREITGTKWTPEYIRWACEASLRRLQTDYIDLYQLHFGDVPDEEIGDVWATLDQLQKEGLIRSYGWSMGNAERADVYAKQTNGTALQFGSNVLGNAPELFAVCERHNLASVVNSPLGMGLLSGKFDANSRLPADDVRAAGHSWVTFFADGRPRPEVLERLAEARDILTSGGRTLAQGAPAWVWAPSPRATPIPGLKTLRQIEENAGALRYGPLTDEQMREIESLLAQQAAV